MVLGEKNLYKMVFLMKKTEKSLTICMPALNESQVITKTLTEIYLAAKEVLNAFEIVVVDDGSKDKTADVVKNLIVALGPEIKLIQKEVNEGLGAAFKSVLDVAKYDFILSIPSDDAYAIDKIKILISKTGDAQAVLGYRENINNRPWFRRFISACVTCYVMLLSGKRIKDAQGPLVLPVDLCKQFPLAFSKYNFQMQILSFVLSRITDFIQIPVIYSVDADKHSGMLRKNVLIDVIKSSIELLFVKLKRKL